jgi:outer membrane receptor protein involved in Fe transport
MADLRGRPVAAVTLLAAMVTGPLPASGSDELTFRLEEPKATAGAPLVVRGAFSPPGLVGRARLRFRPRGPGDFRPVDMARVSAGPEREVWEAVVPGEEVRTPTLEFFIVVQTTQGKPMVVYGTAKQPASVEVAPAPVEMAQAEPVANPLETEEERELRTGERAGGGTLAAATGPLRRTRAQPSDLRTLETPAEPGMLQEEFAVYAAEDATAIAATYAQSTRTAPGIITVFSRGRIEQMGARDLLDILKVIPGFETSKTVLGFDEVSVRGIRSDPEILLLVDGHRVANIYDGRIPWAIPAEIIERVEVIRGPGSALYGTGAFLGVINVVTREQEWFRVRSSMGLLKPSAYLLNGKSRVLPSIPSPNPVDPKDPWNPGGPYNPDNDIGALGLFAPEASVAGGGRYQGFKGYASGQVRVSRGERSPVAVDSFSDTGLARPPESMQTDARNATAAFTAKVDYAPPFLRGGHGFGRTFLYSEDRGPYFGVFDTLGPRSQLRWLLGTADVGYAQPFGEGGEAVVRLYGDGHFVDRRLQLTPDGFSTVDRDGDGQREVWPRGVLARNVYISTTGGAEARLLLPLIYRHRLNVGVLAEGNAIPHFRYSLNRDENGVALSRLRRPPLDSLQQDQNCPPQRAASGLAEALSSAGGKVPEPGDPVPTPCAVRAGGALYVQDEWRVLDRMYATVGLRVNYFSDVEWDPRTHVTPRAALVFEPVDDLAFKILYGAAFRAPTFEEKYDKTSQSYADFSAGVFIGNDKLEPEYIHTAEAGVDWGFNLGPFKHKVAANAFYSFIGNSIDRIDESGTQEPVRNRGFRHVVGWEGEVRGEFAPNTYVFANVSWHRGWFAEPTAGLPRADFPQPASYVEAAQGFPGPYQDTKVSYLTVVPQYRANVGANVEVLELVSFHGEVLLGSERRNNVRSTLERLRGWRIPSYALVNLSARTRPIMGWLGLEARLHNALDYDYRDDVPRPDRVNDLLPREGTTALVGAYLQH